MKREQAWPFAHCCQQPFASDAEWTMPQNHNKARMPCCQCQPTSSLAIKQPQTRLSDVACLLLISTAGLVPAHGQSESTNCRPKYVTLLLLSIKQWDELKQEVAKILLQAVERYCITWYCVIFCTLRLLRSILNTLYSKNMTGKMLQYNVKT